MDFRTRKRGQAGFDMTPMVDCVFQLLIFFLLSSSFLTPALNLKLPRAQASQPSPTVPVVVSLDADERVLVNQQVVARSQLHRHLTDLFAKNEKREAVLRAHKGLAYEKIFEVLQTIQRAGGAQVHLAYEGER